MSLSLLLCRTLPEPVRMRDCEQSPRRAMAWPTPLRHRSLPPGHALILQEDGPPIAVNASHLDHGQDAGQQEIAHDPVQAELRFLRLEVRELRRRVRSLEADQDSLTYQLRFLERIAIAAQTRWRIWR